MKPRVDFRLTRNARSLRNGATEQERAVWRLLSRYRPRFTRQLPIGPFIAHFACRQARLVVEIDGSQHVDSAADAERTKWLEANGWTVVRFWNGDVSDNPEAVVEAIVASTDECLGGTHPQPLPSREGRERRHRVPD